MIRPNVGVILAPGINCNEETAYAFELAGANVEQVHMSELRSGARSFDEFGVVAWSGGFSHGDDIASGRILGLELKTQMADELNRYVDAGKFMIGICNGFQVLVESGLLPDGRINPKQQRTTTLAHNENGQFECRWEHMRVEESACEFADPAKIGKFIELPVAHGEGRFLQYKRFSYEALFDSRQVVVRYSDSQGRPTQEYPDNPNGSPFAIGGITDPSGQILGMMPHPERFVRPEQYVNYHRNKAVQPQGLPLFRELVKLAAA